MLANALFLSSPLKLLKSLAYPGLWWRVTVLVLIMCANSTASIGSTFWKDSPTMRSLIKMVVSNRYRFPTVDGDDAFRDEMKRAEQKARDEVRTQCC